MAEQISPTRSNLLAKRGSRRLAVQGADLLKRKRDALIGEFFALVHESLAAREELQRSSKEAYLALFFAKAWDGPEAVESLALGRSSGLSVNVQMESIYGLKIPRVGASGVTKELPFSPIGVGAKTIEAAMQFERLVEAIIKIAATENKLRRIGEEIKKTSRRVNALEQVVIPGIQNDVKFIQDALYQRALEEVTTLKRIKAKIEYEDALARGDLVSEHEFGN